MDTSARSASLEPSADHPAFPVVGIGASAGGLEAFTHLFEHLPATTSMAYVVIQHLDPSHPSLLPGLLSRITRMPVQEGYDGLTVEPDHVYVMPSNVDMTIEQGVLTLRPRTQHNGQHFAIDTFFRSLAHDRQQRAIGVLLSGTASDGTLGLQAIKAAGGITFAQDAHSAAFPQMPQSAIDSGCVDRVLPPEEIARELARLSVHPYIVQSEEPTELPPDEEQSLTALLRLLRTEKGVDFLAYKPATLKRRIQHRMAVLHLDRLSDYVAYLETHHDEVEALYQNVLVHVTSFFRDPDAFDALGGLAFPAILEQHTSGDPIRVWVSGCSTGEEAYSLLICLREFLDERSLSIPVQLFATDINPKALEQARVGIYPAAALREVSPRRLQQFFIPVDRARRSYRIATALRDRCIFALHNVAKDPPFSHLDLVSCRNLLIYLKQDLQRKVLQTFHYALNPQGFLWLGTSESVGPQSRLFAVVELHQKLYFKKASGRNFPLSLIMSEETPPVSNAEEGGTPMPEETIKGGDLQQEADRLLLANYTPASVVIDADMEILHVRGHTSPYLELAPGKAGLNLLNMVRDGLGLALRTAVHAAGKEHHLVTKDGLQVSAPGATRQVRITVIPLKTSSGGPYFLVLFGEMPSVAAAALPSTEEQASRSSRRGSSAQRIAFLEQELSANRAEMQTMLEERDAANEELQTAIEEIRASNEELQAINEELTTANTKLHSSNEQLRSAQEYAGAIVETVREPLVVLSSDLRVQRANTAFYQFYRMMPQDTEGHVLTELGSGQWNIPQLRTLLEQILATNQSFSNYQLEQTFPMIGHKIMLLNARRLLRERERPDEPLILLAMEDISERREIERQKDALFGMVSHELKDPINNVKLAVQLLERQLAETGYEEATTLLGKIKKQLDEFARLIDETLDVTAIEGGTMPWHPATFAIDGLVRETVEQVEQSNPDAHVLLENEVHTDVYGDEERTRQVFTNLLTNALKYSSLTYPIQVRLSTGEEDVIVSVQDHGVGIPKDQQARLFERFYQDENVGQPGVPGLGLGLYIAAEITKRQGGRIWVESEPGKGAIFSFTIPRRKAQESI